MDGEENAKMTEVDTAHIYGWAYRLLQNHHDALDATQEVLLRWIAAGQRATHRRAWLRRTTFNHCIDLLRIRRRRPTASDAIDPTDDQSQYAPDRDELRWAIADGLHRLTDQQRAVIIAKVYDRQTFAKIAADMGLAISTIKTHYIRALAALREPLRAFVETES